MNMRRILVIDDSAFICEALGGMLREAGFDVHVARDLWDIEKWTGKPDLVLMDVVLQEAFGDDVASLLRATRGYTCPILLMSSLSDSELDLRAKDAGLDGYVSKRRGLPNIVERARVVLGGAINPIDPSQLAGSFKINAHQRLRRVIHIGARSDHWNASAVVAEMHALAGDADLVGATEVAEAARRCRDTVEQQGIAGSTPDISATIEALARVIGETPPKDLKPGASRKLLILDDGDFCRLTLLAVLDSAGHVVVEARNLAEARQKLRAADYDLILLDETLKGSEPGMIPEIRAHMPNANLAILGDTPSQNSSAAVLAKDLGPERLLEQIERLMAR